MGKGGQRRFSCGSSVSTNMEREVGSTLEEAAFILVLLEGKEPCREEEAGYEKRLSSISVFFKID